MKLYTVIKMVNQAEKYSQMEVLFVSDSEEAAREKQWQDVADIVKQRFRCESLDEVKGAVLEAEDGVQFFQPMQGITYEWRIRETESVMLTTSAMACISEDYERALVESSVRQRLAEKGIELTPHVEAVAQDVTDDAMSLISNGMDEYDAITEAIKAHHAEMETQENL